MPEPARPAPLLRSYLTNDARFAIPADWRDRSLVILTAPSAVGGPADGETPDGSPACSLTLHHDVLGPGEDLTAYGARQLAQLGASLGELELLREGPRAVGGAGGAAGWEAEFRWTDQRGLRLHQHQVSVVRPTAASGPAAAPPAGHVLTWTATALASHYADYADDFAAVLDSIRLVRPGFVFPGGDG